MVGLVSDEPHQRERREDGCHQEDDAAAISEADSGSSTCGTCP